MASSELILVSHEKMTNLYQDAVYQNIEMAKKGKFCHSFKIINTNMWGDTKKSTQCRLNTCKI